VVVGLVTGRLLPSKPARKFCVLIPFFREEFKELGALHDFASQFLPLLWNEVEILGVSLRVIANVWFFPSVLLINWKRQQKETGGSVEEESYLVR